MTSTTTNINLGSNSQSNSTSSPLRLSGKRSHNNSNTQATKKFKPDLQDNSNLCNESLNSSSNNSILTEISTSEIRRERTVNQELRRRDLKEGYYNSPLGGLIEDNFIGDANPDPASSLTSPSTASVQSCENVTELDLDSPEAFSDHDSVQVTDWKEYLETLRQKKGLMCVDPSFDGEFLTFKCSRDHTFSTKRAEEIVCPKCQVIIEKCSEYARLHKGKAVVINAIGKLLMDDGDAYLHFQCENDHIWKIKHSA